MDYGHEELTLVTRVLHVVLDSITLQSSWGLSIMSISVYLLNISQISRVGDDVGLLNTLESAISPIYGNNSYSNDYIHYTEWNLVKSLKK